MVVLIKHTNVKGVMGDVSSMTVSFKYKVIGDPTWGNDAEWLGHTYKLANLKEWFWMGDLQLLDRLIVQELRRFYNVQGAVV